LEGARGGFSGFSYEGEKERKKKRKAKWNLASAITLLFVRVWKWAEAAGGFLPDR